MAGRLINVGDTSGVSVVDAEMALTAAELVRDALAGLVAGTLGDWTGAGSAAFTALRKSKLSIEYAVRWARTEVEASRRVAISRGKRIIRGSSQVGGRESGASASPHSHDSKPVKELPNILTGRVNRQKLALFCSY